MSKARSVRQERGGIDIKTIEEQYGIKFNAGSDKKLGSYLRKRGYPSLIGLIEPTPRTDESGKK